MSILRNWTFSRLLRLVLGVIVVFDAVNSKDTLIGIGGIFFIGMAIFNVGCCGVSYCYKPLKKDTRSTGYVIYKEVK